MGAWIDWLRCPRCAGACEGPPPVCRACRFEFPVHGGIACVVARPHELVDGWRFRLHEAARTFEDARARIVAELATLELHPRTRARLERLHAAIADHRARLLALLAEDGITPAPRTRDDPPGVPGEDSITSYYHQIHRDWGWEDDGSTEPATALHEVAEVLAGTPPLGDTLVIGAGACRLPIDVHTQHGGATTIAIDIAPLPMLVARRILAGQSVELFELPVSPKDGDHVAVLRTLRARSPVAPGFVQLFADGLDPPFEPGSFDTVFTPWFIDQVPADAATFFPVVHRMLKPGGRWLDTGPLLYHPHHTQRPHRYPPDELLALVEAAGFRIERHRRERLLYMESPACSQGRTEAVLSFVATKVDAPAKTQAPQMPSWLDDPREPIPRFEELARYVAPHPFFTAVIEAIDGTRSASDIAALLVAKNGLPANAALGGVQACLREMWRATR
jgi:SAM-dependent methyltransferase